MQQALNSARLKAYCRLMPVLMMCYIIAYVDRNNVAIAKLTMSKDLPAFDNSVIGFGAGIFFLGYFLLEIPGSIIVERWSARKWICRIMVTWGLLAAATAFVKTPFQFYCVRFFLGLAEAGFFPGVLIFLTHWFPAKDRARAISMFLVASPIAMIAGPLISRLLINIGTTQTIDDQLIVYPAVMGLVGWQWVYIVWGIPAVILGFLVLFLLPDHPKDAKFLSSEEKESLTRLLSDEKATKARKGHTSLIRGLSDPKILLLATAYFGIVTANYGIEIFLPSIIKEWYELPVDQVALLAAIPSLFVVIGQLSVGWSSDHFGERRWHASLPVVIGVIALALAPATRGNLPLTIVCFVIAAIGLKSYMPAFWAIPSLFLTSTAAAGSVGLINSVGNLGGFLGPYVLGKVETVTKSFVGGIYFIAFTSLISSLIIMSLPLRKISQETSDPSTK